MISPELQARIDELPTPQIRVIAKHLANRGYDAVDACREAWAEGVAIGVAKARQEATK
jgi:hypothetical protein